MATASQKIMLKQTRERWSGRKSASIHTSRSRVASYRRSQPQCCSIPSPRLASPRRVWPMRRRARACKQRQQAALSSARPSSCNSHLMRFLDLMRGAFSAAPTSDDPVRRMPLSSQAERGAKEADVSACSGADDRRAMTTLSARRSIAAAHVASPCGSDDRQADGQTDAHRTVRVRVDTWSESDRAAATR